MAQSRSASGGFGRRSKAGLTAIRGPIPLTSLPRRRETFARAGNTTELVVVCLRNERQNNRDCNRNARIFQKRARALSLRGERAGEGQEANSIQALDFGTVKFTSPPADLAVSQFNECDQRPASTIGADKKATPHSSERAAAGALRL
jgi:hypothetical protein